MKRNRGRMILATGPMDFYANYVTICYIPKINPTYQFFSPKSCMRPSHSYKGTSLTEISKTTYYCEFSGKLISLHY